MTRGKHKKNIRWERVSIQEQPKETRKQGKRMEKDLAVEGNVK